MKNCFVVTVVLLVSLSLFGCKVKKTDEDTYNVTIPTEKAREAARQMSERAKEANEQMQEAAQEAAPVIEEKARDAAKGAGKAIEKAGKEIQQHSKPGDQP